MEITSALSTELFVGPPEAPLQLVRVAVAGCAEPTRSASTAPVCAGARSPKPAPRSSRWR